MGANVDELAEPLRTSVVGLLAEANAGGTRVVVSSARRTRDEQVALRRQNCGQTDYDIWQKPSGDCKPETAIPGTSKHETGQAVDFGGDLTLVGKLAGKYQLVRTVPRENWHYEHASTVGGGAAPDGTGPISTSSGLGSVLSAPGAAAKAVIGLPGAVLDKTGLSVITDLPSAVIAAVRALLDPSTWLRVVGVLAGGGMVTIGLVIIARDLGATIPVTPTGAARMATRTTPARAAGAANPATPPT